MMRALQTSNCDILLSILLYLNPALRLAHICGDPVEEGGHRREAMGTPFSQPSALPKEVMPTRVLLSSMRGPPESPLQTPLPSLESVQI